MAHFESNIGLAKVEYLRLFKNKPQFFLLWGGLAFLFLVMALATKIYALIALSLICTAGLCIYAMRFKGLFYNCDVNIAKILDDRRSLYAVGLNLGSQGMPEKLCVVINKGHVPFVEGFELAEKGYFPAVTYPNYDKKPDDADKVMTLPYTLGVSDAEKLKFQYDHLASNIDDFEMALKLVPKPYKSGLYYIDPDKL